jgi:hypothetical protein
VNVFHFDIMSSIFRQFGQELIPPTSASRHTRQFQTPGFYKIKWRNTLRRLWWNRMTAGSVTNYTHYDDVANMVIM